MLQGPQERVRYSDVLCPDVAAGIKKHCWVGATYIQTSVLRDV